MSFPRVCTIAGVSEDDKCPKGVILRQLMKKLNDVESCMTRTPVFARLHVTSESCSCSKNKHPHAGKKKRSFELQTLDGQEAHPDKFYFEPLRGWHPPVQKLNKVPHRYTPCFNGRQPPTKNCEEIDCQFSTHLDKKGAGKDPECCYIECEREQQGFRDWRPKYSCNHPAFCKASCFDHPTTNDFFNVHPPDSRKERCDE
ncbi:hypothetical protein O3M35_010854 [Rhynocoris fuscipes]|uniref:Uncharacterized protein n=1 Tax=Rhynocoris fuscipes TaxID=488301 RepID=A0AAW1D1H8_9HEMI